MTAAAEQLPRIHACARRAALGIVRAVAPSFALRSIAGGSLAAILLAGMWLSGKFSRESDARVAGLPRSTASSAADDALSDRASERAFERALQEDAAALQVPPVTLATMLQPNPYFVEVKEPLVIAPGKSWSSPRLRIDASVERVTYQQHGATVAASHAIATITNVSRVPVAYLARLTSAQRGRCDVRGARMHNAMALMPGERAEVVVCAGGGGVQIDRLEVLEITELGHRYVSQIPPATVGHDGTTTGSHRPNQPNKPCTQLDTGLLSGRILEGKTRWVDVMDFFSRHNCHRHALPDTYRLAEQPLRSLPATVP